jgi:hypothetical protein
MQEVTIAGEVFKIAPKYDVGHILTDNEASTLNQTFFENIRNNMAGRVKDAKEKGDFDLDLMQDEVTQYASEYEFGARRGGGGVVRDPVEAEALKLVKRGIQKALVDAHGRDHGVSAEQITAHARKVLASEKGAKYREQAEQIVSITRAAAEEELEGLDIKAA